MILPIILLIATFLRFYNLGAPSLWMDEVFTVKFSQFSLIDIWNYTTTTEFNPPLFYWLEHFVIEGLGTSEVVVRLLPAYFGALTIIPAYLLGKRIGGYWTGIGTAWMLAVSTFAVWFSQEARGYTLSMLAFTWGLCFWFAALERDAPETEKYLILMREKGYQFNADSVREFYQRVENRNWLYAILLLAVAIWSHFYAIVYVVILILLTAISYRKTLERNFVLWMYVLAGCVAPVIVPTIWMYNLRVTSLAASGYHGWEVIVYSFGFYVGSVALLAIIYLVLLVISVIRIERKKILLLGLIFIPILIGIPLSYSITIVPRYFLFGLVPFFALLVDAWKPFTAFFKNWRSAAVVFALLISLNLPFLGAYYGTYEMGEYHSIYSKADWRGVGEYFTGEAKPGDIVMVTPGYRVNYEFWYYYDNTSHGVMLSPGETIDGIGNACAGVSGACWLAVSQDNTGMSPEHEVQVWADTSGKWEHMKDIGLVKIYKEV